MSENIAICDFVRNQSRLYLSYMQKPLTQRYRDGKWLQVKGAMPEFVNSGISENDICIAATALRHSLIVVSCDSEFERMQQVREFSFKIWV